MKNKDVRRRCGKVHRALFHLMLIVGGVTGLKDFTINVPPMVRSGDTVTLTCTYDLEGASLYTTQWYLNGVEFYTYATERDPPKTTFTEDRIHVNVSGSDMNSVTLVNVSRNLSGEYSCEVTKVSARFHSAIKKAKMEVVDAPKTDPTIGSEKERIAVGETLKANCTSGASRPASTITWMLNGNLIANDSSIYRVWSNSTLQEDDTAITTSRIEFEIANSMFRNNRLQLRCVASISDVYRKSVDREIAIDEPLIALIRGDASSHSHSSSASVGISRWCYGAATSSMILATMVLMTSSSMTNALLTALATR